MLDEMKELITLYETLITLAILVLTSLSTQIFQSDPASKNQTS